MLRRIRVLGRRRVRLLKTITLILVVRITYTVSVLERHLLPTELKGTRRVVVETRVECIRKSGLESTTGDWSFGRESHGDGPGDS